MRRLFLRLYVAIALTVLGLFGGSLYVQQQDLEAADTARFEAMVRPLIERARARADFVDGRSPEAREPGPLGARRRSRGDGPPDHRSDGLLDRVRGPIAQRGWDVLSDAWGVGVVPRRPSDLSLTAAEQRQLGAGELVSTRNRSGERYAYAKIDDGTTIELGPFPPAAGTSALRQAAVRLVLATGLFGIILFLLLRPVERRLQAIKQASSSFGAGAYDTRVVDETPDEVGALALSFNDMAARVQRAIEQRRELLQSVSHELRTPLGRLAFRIEELALAEGASDRERQREAAERSIAELDSLVDELLTYARLDAEWADEATELVDVFELFERCVAQESDQRLRIRSADAKLVVRGSEALLKRALSNLVHNALRYATTRVELRAERHGDIVRLIVDDDGPGVPTDERERLFSPFAQRDAARGERGAVGLGLAIVARTAERHGGRAVLEHSPLGGCRAVVEVPVSPT